MARLHLTDIDPKEKARWGRVARHLGYETIEAWAMEVLTAAAAEVTVPPPLWMTADGFSQELCDYLVPARVRGEIGRRSLEKWPALTKEQRRELEEWVDATL